MAKKRIDRHKLQIQRNNVSRLYRTPATNFPRRRNAINISAQNTVKHELTKALIGIQLCRYGRINLSNKVIDLIRQIDEICSNDGIGCERSKEFITEAEEVSTKERADVVCLDTGERYEVETDISRAARWKDRNVTCVIL